ncbi:centrosome-associated protein CEP250-like [Oenanthe melanoleuca]|uniref:centrosome-associated protein CEP250-like n=1 Tax=Oenanthe melanoleuca TaxID=2939378 RepID=UPI0024C123FD|nr:centrosome-associated protein CEP250-like [Oenanthe melanoleuca]
MRYLEKKNEMHAAEMRNHGENSQQLEVEREGMQEELEHGTAALKKWIDSAQVLRAALNKSEMSKGTLKKHLDILKEKTCIQPAFEAQVKQLFCMSDASLESEQPAASPEKEKTEWPEWSTEPRRTGEQPAAGAEGEQLSEHPRKAMECVQDVVATSEDKAEKHEATTDPRRTYEVEPEGSSIKRIFRSVHISDTIRLDVPQSAQHSMSTSAEASQEQESLSRALEQLHQESSGQGHALAQVCREKELLGQEKAALEGQLAAMEQQQHDLCKELAETRSAKESLESSLFAAQQQVSQLEITRNHLEAQMLTVMQAKEVIQGEVKCLQRELEAERALRRQEQEGTAQQLLQAEQQHQESLRLQRTAQQLELNKLLQDLASERERHHAEMQEQWEKEKAEREQEHQKILSEMRQKFATLEAQQEAEQTRFENAKREVLLEEQNERSALSEALLQTRGELSQACQQIQQLRQELKEQQEKEQTIKAELQAELQEARSEIQAAQRRHKEELQGVREEMNLLLEQRDAVQKQVGELTSQLAASQESQEAIVQRAQKDVSWAQDQSRQKLLEVEHTKKQLEEAEHQNKELQVHLQNLEREWSQWKEVAQQNSELQASVNVLEREKARLILSLEEKNLCLRTLEEKNLELNNQVSQFHSALQENERLRSKHGRELQELNSQIQALQDTALEMEAAQATREKELLQELEESRAGERCLKASVHALETEVSQLHVSLQRCDDKVLALDRQCNTSELELRKAKAQMDKLRTHNQELQKKLEESEQDWWKEELKHASREIALQKEATERQEEAESLHQEVASLQRKLEILEKQHERELYQQQMRYLEKKNEMHAAEMRNHGENSQQLEVEREGMQEELEHGTAALKKWIDSAQVLRAALNKSEMSKGTLKKHLDILKEKTCIQPAFEAQVKQLFCMSDASLESEQPAASPEKEKTEWPEWSTEPRRTGEQPAAGAEGEQLSEHPRKAMERVRDVVATSEDKAEKHEATTDPRRTYEVEPEGSSIKRIFRSVHISDTIRLDVPQSAQHSMSTSAEPAAGAEGEQLSEHPRKAMERVRDVVATSEDKAEKHEATTDPRRTYEGPEGRRIRTFRRVFPPDYFTLPVHESAQQNTSTSEREDSSSGSGEQQQPSC